MLPCVKWLQRGGIQSSMHSEARKNIISPVSSWSAPVSPLCGTCLKILQKEAPRRHPNQTPGPPHLTDCFSYREAVTQIPSSPQMTQHFTLTLRLCLSILQSQPFQPLVSRIVFWSWFSLYTIGGGWNIQTSKLTTFPSPALTKATPSLLPPATPYVDC